MNNMDVRTHTDRERETPAVSPSQFAPPAGTFITLSMVARTWLDWAVLFTHQQWKNHKRELNERSEKFVHYISPNVWTNLTIFVVEHCCLDISQKHSTETIRQFAFLAKHPFRHLFNEFVHDALYPLLSSVVPCTILCHVLLLWIDQVRTWQICRSLVWSWTEQNRTLCSVDLLRKIMPLRLHARNLTGCHFLLYAACAKRPKPW